MFSDTAGLLNGAAGLDAEGLAVRDLCSRVRLVSMLLFKKWLRKRYSHPAQGLTDPDDRHVRRAVQADASG